MSPKKKKGSKRKKGTKKKSTPSLRVLGNKKNKKRATLKDKLQKVYHDTIDLSTTCSGRCECCKAACPAMNYCEFTQLVKEVWDKESLQSKTELICKSIEYFFKNEYEKWGMDTLVKPCMLLDAEDRCKYYESRPLSCRMYGQWPDDVYKARVDKFEKAYEGLLKREELPLNTQCPFVERVDKETIENQIVELKNAIREKFSSQMPDLDI
jgi:Fe-S-cluster containining protein